MTDFTYETVYPIDRERLLRDLASSDPKAVANALYAACRSEEDTKWLEDECVKRLKAADLEVRWAAATCLGDLAFFRRPLDARRVATALEAEIHDSTISDPASFSLRMVREFLI